MTTRENLDKLASGLALGVITAAMSLAAITALPAFIAACAVSAHQQDSDVKPWHFFAEFRRIFIRTLPLSFVALLVAGSLIVDLWFILSRPTPPYMLAVAVCASIVGFTFACCCVWIPVLAVRTDLGWIALLRSAFGLAFRRPRITLPLLGVALIGTVLCAAMPYGLPIMVALAAKAVATGTWTAVPREPLVR